MASDWPQMTSEATNSKILLVCKHSYHCFVVCKNCPEDGNRICMLQNEYGVSRKIEQD